jgi:transcriptional regulator with XRE-family HTH domain
MATELGQRIGERIRQVREAAGITQSRLAVAVEKTAVSISNIERGQVLPGLVTLEAIATALGTSLRELIPRASQSADDDETSQSAQDIKDQVARLGKSDRKILTRLIRLMLADGEH